MECMDLTGLWVHGAGRAEAALKTAVGLLPGQAYYSISVRTPPNLIKSDVKTPGGASERGAA